MLENWGKKIACYCIIYTSVLVILSLIFFYIRYKRTHKKHNNILRGVVEVGRLHLH